MGCNCGNKNGAGTWVYTKPDGTQVTYKTQVEANAAKIRNGHQGTVASR